jgi:hypothetical protein
VRPTMSRKQAANFLEMTTQGIRHLQKNGDLQGRRDSRGHFRFDVEMLQALKARRRREGIVPRHSRQGLTAETSQRTERRRLARAEKREAEAAQKETARIEREQEERRLRDLELARGTLDEWDVAEVLGLTVHEVQKLEQRGRLRSIGSLFESRYDRESVEKLRLEFVELGRETLTADQASKLLGCARGDVRRLAKRGVVHERSDPLGDPRYARADVLAVKEANEAKRREEAARWEAPAALSDPDFLRVLAALLCGR